MALGDEFDQYKRPVVPAMDDDEFAQYRRSQQAANPGLHLAAPEDAASKPPDDSVLGGFFRRAGGMIKSGIASSIPVPSMDDIRQTADNPTFANKLRLFAHSTPGIAGPARMLEGQAGAETEAAHQIGEEVHNGEIARPIVTGLSMLDPFATGSVTNVNRLEDEGRNREAIGQGGFDIGTLAAGSKPGGKVISKVLGQGALSKNMDIAAPNEPFTPRELLEGAREHGINPDLADATKSGVPVMTKRLVSRTMGGAGTFERAQQGNVSALDEWGNQYLDRLSKFSGENAGARIQDALKNDYAQRKGAASQEFEDLDKRVGPNTIDGTQTVEAEAVKIRDAMKPYYDRHPELVPKQAWSIVNDLAERPTVTVKGPQGTAQVPTKSNNFSWSELHQLRSDLMDIYRTNPDLVKSRSDAWLQQMVKTIDDTMTGAASNLSPADKWQFRQANETWEGLKQTYDNPAHPLYHAVRAQQPSQVTNMLLNMRAPEFARQMRGVLGPEFGDLQRAAAERILGQDRTGAGYDFKSMPGRLKNYPPAYINDLLGPQAARDLRMMSRTGMTIMANENPSGTSHVLTPVNEARGITIGAPAALATGHPLIAGAAVAAPFVERGVAGAMNSPRAVDYFTSPRRAFDTHALAIAVPGANTMNEHDAELARRLLLRRGEMAGPR